MKKWQARLGSFGSPTIAKADTFAELVKVLGQMDSNEWFIVALTQDSDSVLEIFYDQLPE